MNGLDFDLAAVVFGLFIGAVAYLAIFLWRLAHPQRPIDWETDYPEYGHAKECHVKVTP